MRLTLFITLSFLSAGRCLAQQSDKDILLKDVGDIILPANPDYAYATISCNEQTQIIAVAITQDQQFLLPAIISSRLGKGRLLIFGSERYLQKPLSENKHIRQLISNSLRWAKGNSLPGRKDVQRCEHDSLVIRPSTGVVILTRDITTATELSTLEAFIRQGGTLIFGSPLSEIRLRQNLNYYDASLNKLFIKAGLYHVFMPFQPEGNHGQLQTDSIPPYLHINTTLKAVTTPGFSCKAAQANMYASTITNYLFNNDDTATIFRKIIAVLDTPGHRPIVPTRSYAVIKEDTKNYLPYVVQQCLISRQLNSHPDPGYVDPSSSSFPGAVAPTVKRVDESVTIPVLNGRQGLTELPSVFHRWHSTGFYVPAGEKVKITIDTLYAPLQLKARIGVHDDDLQHMDYFTRHETDLTRTFGLTSTTTDIYSPFGGLLLIEVPDTSSLKKITFHISGAVKTPYFKTGMTNLAEWQRTIRQYPGPWAELATDKIILTVPSYRIRQLDDPEKLLGFWDDVMDADAKLASIPTVRTHPERIIIDQQVAFGYMFTSPLKIVAPDDASCQLMLDEAQIRAKGSWGHFHELGHRHQFWGIDFTGLGEVTANLYTMYVYDKVLHKGLYNHENIPGKDAVIANIRKYMADKPSFEKFCNDPFLALSMYIELIENFGWQSIERVFARYRSLQESQYPGTDADKRDYWFICISEVTGRDLSTFFDKWQIPVTEKAKAVVKSYPGWLPEELK